MLKIACTILQILTGLYLAGNMSRQNAKVDAFVGRLEHIYGNFNERLRDAEVRRGLTGLSRIYAWIATLAMIVVIVFLYGGQRESRIFEWSSIVFFAAYLGWFSIKWCLEHRKAVADFGWQPLVLVAAPLLLAVIDSFAMTGLFQPLMDQMRTFPFPEAFQPYLSEPLAVAAALSLCFGLGFAAMYVMTWVISVPVAITSIVMITLPITLARVVHAIAPNKAFTGFVMLVFIVSTLATLWT